MNEQILKRIRTSQAKEAIRSLSNHSRDRADIMDAAELLKDDERYAGVDLQALAEQIADNKLFWQEEAMRRFAA